MARKVTAQDAPIVRVNMMTVSKFTRHAILAALTASLLSGCAALDRIANIGQPPPLSPVDNPTTRPGYKPVQMPMPAAQPASYNPNSLWRNGSRAFFKDQRAHQVGDILTIKVNFTDQANITNETQRSRSNKENSTVNNFFGLNKLPILNSQLPTTMFNGDSSLASDGKGSVARQEQLVTNVAGVVTQVLPNGNLVVEGKQEIRVNFEMRELIIAGVIRPEDIESDNTIDSSKIAQTRLSYGGRGQITDVQQPPYGDQVLDIMLPF
jgi:flagellar L-ring protein FlgH